MRGHISDKASNKHTSCMHAKKNMSRAAPAVLIKRPTFLN